MGRARKGGHHGQLTEVRPGVWKVRVQRGVKAVRGTTGAARPYEGKPRVHYETVEGTREDAQMAADAIWERMGEERTIGDRMSLSRYFDDYYVPDHLRHRAKKTARDYVGVFDRHIRPYFGADWPPDISFRRAQLWLDSLDSPSLQRRVVRIARAIVNAMVAQVGIREPVTFLSRLEYRPLQKRRKPVWDASEVLEAMERLEGDPIERIFLVMAAAGTRKEEALALIAPSDFAFEELPGRGLVGRARISRAYSEDDGLALVKTRVERTITIGEPFASRLAGLMPPPDAPEPLFPSSRGSRSSAGEEVGDDRFFEGCLMPSMLPNSVARAWAKLFREERVWTIRGHVRKTPAGPLCGMRRVEFESLRHANETLAVEGGLPTSLTSLAHGHSREVSYGHYIGERGVADANAEAVRRRLEEAAGEGL